MNIAGSAQLGISEESIFVCATAPIVELKPGDVPSHIHSVMALAASIAGPSGEPIVQEALSREEIRPDPVPGPILQTA